MAKYYYKKYTDKLQYLTSWTKTSYITTHGKWPPGDTYDPQMTNASLEAVIVDEMLNVTADTGFSAKSSFNKVNDQFETLNPGGMYVILESPSVAYTCRANRSLSPYQARKDDSAGSSPSYKYTLTQVHVPDALQGEVIAEDGTYPDNGYNEADGFYYIKDRLAIQFFAYMNGAWKVTDAYVRVNGAWKPANASPRLNGAWLV